MITYTKDWWSLPLLAHGFYGSPFARAIWIPCLSTVLAWFLNRGRTLPLWSGRPGMDNMDGEDAAILHEYTVQCFGWIVGFMMVYRTNYSYTRWWEALDSVQRMSSKWGDVCVFNMCWDAAASTPGAANNEEAGERFRQRLVHLCSLMHSLAMQSLRGDKDVNNLSKHETGKKEPTFSAYCSGGKGKPAYATSWTKFRGNYQIFDLSTRHLHKYHACTPVPVVGGASNGEKNVLAALNKDMMDKIHKQRGQELIAKYGERARDLWQQNMMELSGSEHLCMDERVFFVQSEIHWIVVKRRLEGGINVSGPELSRMWQTLTDGNQGYMHARKIVDTPFPFAHAQMIQTALLMFAFFCPTIFVAYVTEGWVLYCLNFITVWAYYGINEVCRELEDPFTYDPNDHPIVQLAHDFNERCMACYHGLRMNLHFCNSVEAVTMLCTAREGKRLKENNRNRMPLAPVNPPTSMVV